MKNIGMKENMKENIQRIWGESLKSLKSLMQIFAESADSANSAKQIFATFATFAMQIFSNFVNLVKFAMQIFHKGSYSAVRVSSVQQPTNIQRISNLSPTVSTVKVAQKSRITRSLPLFATLVLVILGGWSNTAWGDDCTYYQSFSGGSSTANGQALSWKKIPDLDIASFSSQSPNVLYKVTFTATLSNSGTSGYDYDIYASETKIGSASVGKGATVNAVFDNLTSQNITSATKITLKQTNTGYAVTKTLTVSNVKIYYKYAPTLEVGNNDITMDDTPKGGYSQKDVVVTFQNSTNSSALTVTENEDETGYFSISPSSSTLTDCSGTVTYTIRFDPTTVIENATAQYTISGNGASETINVTGTSTNISKPAYSNTFADSYLVEGSPLDLSTLWTSSSPAEKTYEKLDFFPSGSNNSGATEPSVAGSILSLGQAGIVRLRVSQAATTGYYAGDDTIDLEIRKHTPTFTWNTQDHYYYNSGVAPFVTKTSGGTYTVTSNNTEVVSTSGDNVTIYNKPGTASIRVLHPETYYWEEYDHSESITPEKVSNHVPFDYTKAMFDDNTITTTKENVDKWEKFSDGYGEGVTFYTLGWGSHWVIIRILGIPQDVSFKYHRAGGTTGDRWYVYESTDGSNWTQKWKDESSTSGSATVPLSDTTKYVKLQTGGNLYHCISDISFTELQYFRRKGEATTLDYGTTLLETPLVQSFEVEHCNAGTQTIVTAPEHYQVSLNNVDFSSSVTYSSNATQLTGGDKIGEFVVYVKYMADAAGTHGGNVVVSNNLRDNFNIAVTGVTQDKLATHLVYLGESSYNVNHDNIAATTLFEVRDDNNALVSNPAITLSSNATSVIGTVSENTAIDFLCGGSATITASYAGDETYAAANDTTVTITVNKLNDVITWNGVGEDGKIHVWADGSIPNTVASGHGGIATYSSNSSLLTVGGSMGSYTLTTGRASGLPQEVTLTATSAGDCQYNPATDSKTVVIEPCTHRIVWNQDFSSLTLDEFGNIYYAADLNAYAVDSLGDSTRVPIRYSIGTNDFASLQNGTKLVVQKRGETTLTATTDASDKYAVVSVTRTVRVVNYGENRARINGEEWKGNRSWAGPHVRFNMEAPNASYDSYYKELDIKANQKNVIKWTLDKGCNITITNIDLGIGYVSSFIATCKLYINGEQKADFWTTTGSDYSFGVYTLGNNDSILLVTDKDIDLYNVNLVYLISPSDAPTRVSSSVEEVYVTIDEDAKQTVDLSSYFSLEDGVPTDFELEYEVVNANGHAFIADGHNFWANAAGDYQVRARVKAAVDHRPSEWSSPKTITVTRLPNTIYVNGAADYSTTMNMRSTLDVAFTATNTDYEGSPISCEQTAGTGLMSYNPSTGQIESGEVLGSATWRISQPQNSQYLAGETTFTVTLVNNTFVFNGETNTDWGTTSNWTKGNKPTENDNVTVTGVLVIDEEIKVYSLNVEDENAVVTIAPNGGLTVGAGGITGATKDNLKLQAGTEGATKGQTGYLRISPEYTGAMPEAEAELYSTGYYNVRGGATEAAWQHVGCPIDFEGKLASTVFTRSWIYSYDESQDKWLNNRKTLVMEPFKGYSTTQFDSDAGKLLTFSGKLVPTGSLYEIDLAYSGSAYGHNMVANSFAAPIDITQFEETDFVNAEKTIYIFNTGSREEGSALGNSAGQYTAIPISSAAEMAEYFADPENASIPTTIAPMQGFCVNATSAGAKLKFDYKRLVWDANYTSHAPQPMRSPKRAKASAETGEERSVTGTLKITIEADGWADNVYFLESERYAEAYEDGYDAHKLTSGNLNIYAMADEEKLAIDATNSLIGTRVGVRTGEETAYTMTFSHVNSDDDLMLWDIEAEEKVEISEGGMYTFFAGPNSEITNRFIIIEREAPEIATGVEDVQGDAKVHKFIKDDKLFILKNGVLYDATGMRVR